MKAYALAFVAVAAGCHQIVGIESLRDPPPDGGAAAPDAATGSPPDGGDAATPTPPTGSKVRVTSNCQGFTHHEGVVTTGPRLVLIAHYAETNGSDVLVETSAPIVLVLSSYEASHWTIRFAKPGTSISRILLNGAESPQLVDYQPLKLEQHQGTDYFGNVGWVWPGNPLENGDDTQALVASIESATRLTLAAFGGCYDGGSFVISDE
jgi:hypothetical protein